MFCATAQQLAGSLHLLHPLAAAAGGEQPSNTITTYLTAAPELSCPPSCRRHLLRARSVLTAPTVPRAQLSATHCTPTLAVTWHAPPRGLHLQPTHPTRSTEHCTTARASAAQPGPCPLPQSKLPCSSFDAALDHHPAARPSEQFLFSPLICFLAPAPPLPSASHSFCLCTAPLAITPS